LQGDWSSDVCSSDLVLPAGDSVHSVFQVCAVPQLYVAVDLLSARGLRQRQVAVEAGSSGHNHSPRPSGPQPSPGHLHLVKELLSLNEAPHKRERKIPSSSSLNISGVSVT